MAVDIDTHWQQLMGQADFPLYVEAARAFDPVGFDRALADDRSRGIDSFRTAVIEAFEDDRAKH